MLLLYYTNTILFWLSLPNSNSNPSLGKHLDKHDFQYLPQEVCIAQCLERMQASRANKSAAVHHLGLISEQVKKRSLEECVDHCSKLTDISDQNTTAVKQTHENYSLNLICRDESTLNFLINLHTTNERQGAATKFEETDVVPSSRTSSTSSPQLPDSGQSNYEDVVLFIIKIHLANETDIFHVYLSDDKFFTINDLLPNTTYNITAMAVHSTNKYSVIALGEQYQTLRRGYSPGNITDIKVVNFIDDIENPTHLAATVVWKPPPDMTCYYDVICFSPKRDDFEMQPVEIRNPRQLYKYQLENLTFSTEYKVGIRAKNTKNMKESELFWKTFYAPSCAQWYNYNFNICAPDHPQNLQFQLYFGAQYVYSLNVTWNLPTHYPDNYTLSINDVSPIGRTHYFNITKEAQYFFIEEIVIYSSYFEIILTASTVGGTATTIAPGSTDSVIHFPEKTHFVKLFAAVLAPIFCVAILSMTIFMIYHRRAKLKRYQERCKYFEELEKKAPIDPKDNFDFANVLNNSKQHLDALHNPLESDDNAALFNDDMEIERNQLTLHEVLGEGAFGLVKRGIYKDNRLGGKEHEVAVKMLKDHPTADDVRAFRREIEVMKSVEKHPNIVGIIGHCTRFSNDMMLLTEYCSFGNLLDFLRDEWRFLHDIQQKRQTNTFSVVNLELPLVTAKPNQGRFLLTNNSATTQTQHPTASPPTSPPPPVPSMSSLFALVKGGSHPTLETLENLKNNQHKNLNKMEIFNINSSKLIIERFKRKYNDVGKHQRDVSNSGRGNGSLRQMHLQGIEDIEGSTTNSNAISPSSCKTINGVVSQSEYTTTTRLYSQSLTQVSNTSPPPLTSPAAENKSYGYHGCCTNSCKCNVDVIIRNIDSSDSSKEQEELDRLLLRQQQQPSHHHPIKACGTSISIKNCDCRTAKETTHGHPTTPPPRPPATSFSENHKRKSVVENKSYFKIFSSDNHPMPRRHHSVSGHKISLTTKTTAPPLATNTLATSRRVIEDAWPHRVPLTSGDLLDIARQVAVGMDFLSKNKVVHRDLAARNVLVAPDRTIKIADFGLSRDVYQENIYKKTGNGKLPIKWLALESLTHQVYTTQSDVWSYGILLYEIVTLGSTPYPSIPTNRLLHLLKTGYRMEKPKNCGDEFYALMHSCWNGMPNERPTFSEIIKNLDEMLNCMNTPPDTATSTKELVLPPLNAVTTNTSQDESNLLRKNTENNNIDDDEMSTPESPIEQICSDDSYLKPL